VPAVLPDANVLIALGVEDHVHLARSYSARLITFESGGRRAAIPE
jgi:hypothetical protein